MDYQRREDRYRRGLYTYWRRTSPYPSFLTFDAPSRDVCTSRRITTNTPLQALNTLNDVVYLEAAINLAQKSQESYSTHEEILGQIYERATLQVPSTSTLSSLKEVFEESVQYYKDHPKELKLLFEEVALQVNCNGKNCIDLAAYTLVANTVMNLDEFLTKG